MGQMRVYWKGEVCREPPQEESTPGSFPSHRGKAKRALIPRATGCGYGDSTPTIGAKSPKGEGSGREPRIQARTGRARLACKTPRYAVAGGAPERPPRWGGGYGQLGGERGEREAEGESRSRIPGAPAGAGRGRGRWGGAGPRHMRTEAGRAERSGTF